MKNSDIGKMFAEGETKGGVRHLFIEDNIIYSYGHHFIIAIRLNSPEGYKYIFNKNGYSSTTGRHKGYVRRAINGDNIIMETDRIEDYKDMKDVSELININEVIKNNLKVIKEMGLKAGYLLKNKLTGKIVTIKHIHSVYGWVECEGLKQDFSNINDFEVALEKMIMREL